MSIFALHILSLSFFMLGFQLGWLPGSIAKVSRLGWKWAASNRNKTELEKLPAWGQRAERAFNNLKDNTPAFAVAVLLILILELESQFTALCCGLFMIGRITHFASYCIGFVPTRAAGFFLALGSVFGLYYEILKPLFS